MTPIIMDIEASGFGRGSYPIEVGVVMDDRSTHCWIIRPVANWVHWDRSAEALHGISRETLLQSGKPAEVVAQRLNELLGGRTVYTDAWNHDISWLGKLYHVVNLPMHFRVETLRKLMSEEQAAIWHQVKEQVIREQHLARHRASTDAAILQTAFLRSYGVAI